MAKEEIQISARVHKGLLKKLDAWAERRHLRRAAAVRVILGRTLKEVSGKG